MVIDFDSEQIDAIFGDLDPEHPGAAVGIAIGGEPVYRKGFGLAVVSPRMPLSTNTRMRIASVSKQFTCLVYLLLCEDGRVGIDDHLRKHFPEFHASVDRVTMRQLMANTSGLRDAWALKWLVSGVCGPAVSSADILSQYCQIDDVSFAPDFSWVYNNAGYDLIANAIERITGRAFETVLRDRVLDPLGMACTAMRYWDGDALPNCARHYRPTAAGKFEEARWLVHPLGAGAMVSTVDDMLRWLAHMDSPIVGSSASWATLKCPGRLTNGYSTDFGLGLFLRRYRGTETIYHSGGWWGANAQMLKVPAAGLDIIVMVNRHDLSSAELTNQVLDCCLPELTPTLGRESDSLASGTYHSARTGRVIQLYGKEGQQMAAVDGRETAVVRWCGNRLRQKSWWTATELHVELRGGPKSPSSVVLDHFGDCDELDPLKALEGVRADQIVGHYRWDSMSVEATIREGSRGVELVMSGCFGTVAYQDLAPLSGDIWVARSTDPEQNWLVGNVVLQFEDRVLKLNSHAFIGLRPLCLRRVA